MSALELSIKGVEIWHSIPGYENRYEVSNLGKVKSLARWAINNGKHWKKQWRKTRLLKPSIDKDGYLRVSLSDGNYSKGFRIQHLVLEAFGHPQPIGYQCRHLNGNPGDNRLFNLTWGTSKQNNQDKIGHGTVARGEKNGGGGKLTEKQVIEIFKSKEPLKIMAENYGVSECMISAIRLRKCWKHVTN